MQEWLQLLGRPRWGGDELTADKTHLLLYYLAHRDAWLSREEVAFLFWPDADDVQARRNLRQLTYRLKRLPVGELVEAQSTNLRFRGTSDVACCRRAAAEGRWAEVVRHYDGPFLDGVMARDAPGFEAWIELERETLHNLWREAALACATGLERSERYSEAASLLKQVWNYDKLDEPVLQAFLSSCHLAGQRDQALQAYGEFESLVKSEIGLEPLEVTRRMIAAIRDGSARSDHGSGRKPRIELPGVSSRFLGREAELAEVGSLLDRDDCRLLVISGPGGVGKSRLALAIADAHADRHQHGSYFVPLEHVASVEAVPTAVADALGFTLYGTREAGAQLLDYLRDKEMLLVADGLEHLLEASALFSELLAEAPGLRIVITSREQPALTSAWHFRLAGLSYPEAGSPRQQGGAAREDPREALLESDAAKLFIESARRTNPGFEPSDEDANDLLELCRLTEGLPLALELASAWIRHLSLREIADEIRHGLELFDDPEAGGERRRSIRSVFEHSWRLLSPAEQDVLARLSVFRGGVSREAAQQVSGASLYILLSLVGKSLLQKDASGRYDMHNLIRRYAYGKLTEADAVFKTHEQHATYYVHMAESIWPMLDQGKEQEWLQLSGREQANLRTAWDWGVRWERQELIAPLVKPLAAYFSLRSLHREGLALFAEAERTFLTAGPVRARLLARMGNLRLKLEGPVAARGLLEEALQTLEQADDVFELAFTQMNLAAADRADGHLDKAEERLKESLAIFQRLDHEKAVAHTLFNLGSLARLRGSLDEARTLLEECLQIADRSKDIFAAGYARMRLGDVLFESGDSMAARRCFDDSLANFAMLEHPTGSAGALVGLARLALDSDDPATAAAMSRDALDIYEETGDRMGTCEALISLSKALHHLGDADASLHGRRALDTAQELSSTPLVAEALATLLELIEAEAPEQLAGLFLVAEHPALPSRLRREVRDRVLKLEGDLAGGTVERARQLAHSMSLAEVAEQLKGQKAGAGSKGGDQRHL